MKQRKEVSLERLVTPRERLKILGVFVRDGELTLTEVAVSAQLPIEFVEYDLDFFVGVGVLEEMSRNKIKRYRLRIEDERVRAIRNLFNAWDANESAKMFHRRGTGA